MCKSELWVNTININLIYGWRGHTDTHINIMTRPGLRAGPSEKRNREQLFAGGKNMEAGIC